MLSTTPFSKNSTWVTAAPGLAVAVELNGVATPMVAVVPAVSETVGRAATAVTL